MSECKALKVKVKSHLNVQTDLNLLILYIFNNFYTLTTHRVYLFDLNNSGNLFGVQF